MKLAPARRRTAVTASATVVAFAMVGTFATATLTGPANETDADVAGGRPHAELTTGLNAGKLINPYSGNTTLLARVVNPTADEVIVTGIGQGASLEKVTAGPDAVLATADDLVCPAGSVKTQAIPGDAVTALEEYAADGSTPGDGKLTAYDGAYSDGDAGYYRVQAYFDSGLTENQNDCLGMTGLVISFESLASTVYVPPAG